MEEAMEMEIQEKENGKSSRGLYEKDSNFDITENYMMSNE
jgi:hypothetical protein